MNVPFVDLKVQYNSIKTDIDAAIANVIRDTAFVGNSGNKYVKRFEEEFASYLGVSYCIGCGNGTDSIEILLKAFQIGPGDEVIVPAHSWISTSEAVSTVGAIPVFVDTHPLFYTIDPSKIEAKVTSATKAIIPVHLYGLPAEMDPIMEIAAKYNLVVIEDCAQAHGAIYKGRKVGKIGHAASFSFFPGKNLGAYGDAGGMVTNIKEIAIQARMLANHGQLIKHNHLVEGRNSRLDGLQAAILSAKLPYLELWTDARIKCAEIYNEYLLEKEFQLPEYPEYSRHVFHLYVVKFSNREFVQQQLHKAGVETAVHYPTPLPFLDAYKSRRFSTTDFPVAHNHAQHILSLPIYPELSHETIKAITNLL